MKCHLTVNCTCYGRLQLLIYIIIRHCSGVLSLPSAVFVPNSVALASLTLQVGDWAIR